MKKLNINYVSLQRYAFNKIAQDNNITSREVALYYALIGYWNKYYFPEVLSICREELLNYSKIGSVNTYLKAMRNLQKYGFIKYLPSKNANIGSKVKFGIDKTIVCQNLTNDRDTVDKQLIPLINNSKQEQIVQIPEKKEVIDFFVSKNSNQQLATQFYNHNKSIGWKYNGSVIINWKNFADNYISASARQKPVTNSKRATPVSTSNVFGSFKKSKS